jgi:anaerobic ribonucleoside-triphosphate reductase
MMGQTHRKTVGKDIKFDRIRRITGYLVGSTDRFNNAKQAEERDRIKHDASSCQN